jgi:hypothetical protein
MPRLTEVNLIFLLNTLFLIPYPFYVLYGITFYEGLEVHVSMQIMKNLENVNTVIEGRSK